ncbi:MAG: hypothetical protein LBQ01_04305 [Prevotellaceae bacterium]|jgi:hypothetical protein|nr:hypothetical protein [Prevotellaceae bacterium]
MFYNKSNHFYSIQKYVKFINYTQTNYAGVFSGNIPVASLDGSVFASGIAVADLDIAILRRKYPAADGN